MVPGNEPGMKMPGMELLIDATVRSAFPRFWMLKVVVLVDAVSIVFVKVYVPVPFARIVAPCFMLMLGVDAAVAVPVTVNVNGALGSFDDIVIVEVLYPVEAGAKRITAVPVDPGLIVVGSEMIEKLASDEDDAPTTRFAVPVFFSVKLLLRVEPDAR